MNDFERTFQGFRDFKDPSLYPNFSLNLNQYIKHSRKVMHTYLIKVITKENKEIQFI